MDFNPSFEDFTEIRKQGAKVGQGVRLGAGLGSTLRITLIDEMVYYWCKVPADLARHLMYNKYSVPSAHVVLGLGLGTFTFFSKAS